MGGRGGEFGGGALVVGRSEVVLVVEPVHGVFDAADDRERSARAPVDLGVGDVADRGMVERQDGSGDIPSGGDREPGDLPDWAKGGAELVDAVDECVTGFDPFPVLAIADGRGELVASGRDPAGDGVGESGDRGVEAGEAAGCGRDAV